MSKKTMKIANKARKPGQKAAKTPSDEALRAAWQALIQENAAYPRISHLMTDTAPEFIRNESGTIVKMFVYNELQKQWLDEHKIKDFEGRLRELLAPADVSLVIDVHPEEDDRGKAVIFNGLSEAYECNLK